MELRWLEVFVAVAEELHFGRAAERVRMAQSPLSQVVRKLERQLGVSLFDRNTRSVSLTAAGAALLPHARAVLAEIELAQRATRTASGQVYGRVRIGFSGLLNHATLPPLTSAIRRRYPAIELNLVGRSSSAELINALRHGSLDLAFIGLPNEREGIVSRPVNTEPLVALLPADHALAGRPRIDLGDLRADAFVSTPEPSVLREQVVAACLAAGFRPEIVSTVPDAYVLLLLVAAGVGVSLVPESLGDVLPAGCVLVGLPDPAPQLTAGLAWRQDDDAVALRAVLDVADVVLPAPAA